jgi:hypothetical protein
MVPVLSLVSISPVLKLTARPRKMESLIVILAPVTLTIPRKSLPLMVWRLMLGAAHHDWSDERIEQELLVRIEAEGQA